MIESGRGREGTLEGRTPGSDRDLGAGKGRQRGVNHTMEGSHRLVKGTHQYVQHDREAQTSGGGPQAGAPSMFTVVPCPGEMRGKEASSKIDRSSTNGLKMGEG